jgi:hypothetical protein
MSASWRFADCANAIKGDLVRQGTFTPAHIRENNRLKLIELHRHKGDFKEP